MRLHELEKKPHGQPIVYLDMDGVLADFFHEYAKLAGVPANERGRHDYHKIPPAQREPVISQMVGTDFFYRLPKFGSADRLVAMIVQLFGRYSICSSPLRGDHENSRVQKTRWIQDNLNPQPETIVIAPRKGKYAKQPDGTPNILIDDRGSNITEWEAAGGIGIKYQADENGLDVVARGLRRAVEILRGYKKHEPQQLVSRDYGNPTAGTEKTKISEFIKSGDIPLPNNAKLQAYRWGQEAVARLQDLAQRLAQGGMTGQEWIEMQNDDVDDIFNIIVKYTKMDWKKLFALDTILREYTHQEGVPDFFWMFEEGHFDDYARALERFKNDPDADNTLRTEILQISGELY